MRLGLTKALWLRLVERLWFVSTVNTLYVELCHDADHLCIKPRPQSLPNLNQMLRVPDHKLQKL